MIKQDIASGSAGLKRIFGGLDGMTKPGENQAPRSSRTNGAKSGGGMSGKMGAKSRRISAKEMAGEEMQEAY